MAKGRYIKSAERACAGKARFETALEAERTCEWRFRAYPCPVCHGYHLTSRAGTAMTDPLRLEEAARGEQGARQQGPRQQGPRLGDLDWSAALEPKPKPPRPPKPKRPQRPPPPPEPPTREARCVGPAGKDGRVLLVIEGRLVKSLPVKDRNVRSSIAANVEVKVGTEDPPPILSILAEPGRRTLPEG